MQETYRNATLGDLLHERRTTLGMSMRDVAGTTLSPTAINNIEKGKIKPTIETVLYLCQVLQLQPEQALLFYPDFAKSAPALFERVDELLEGHLLDDAVLLLYDMYWVVTEQRSSEDLIAEIQYKLAIAFDQLGRFEQARTVMTEAYKHFLAQKNIERQVATLGLIGSFSLHAERIYRAIANLTEAVDLAHRYQIANESVAMSLTDLAEAHLLHSQLTEALTFNKEAEALYKRLQDEDGIARNALQQGRILTHLDDTNTAYQIVKHTYGYFEQKQHVQELSEACLILGDILCKLDRFDDAKSYFKQALQLRSNVLPQQTFPIVYRLASLELQTGQDQSARTYAQTALERADRPDHQSKVYQLLAKCNLQTGNLDGYLLHMNQASEILKQHGHAYAAALLQCEVADETDDMDLLRNASRVLRKLESSCYCRPVAPGTL